MSIKKVLLYIITRPDIGGAQSHVLDLIKGFCNKYEVHLATGFEGPLTESVKKLNVPVHLLPNLLRPINVIQDFRATRECISLIRTINPDIIHAHSSKAGLISRIAGWKCKVPVVFTAHGWGFSYGNPPMRRRIALLSEKLTASLATKIICVAQSDYDLAKSQGVGNENSLTVVRYGIENIIVPTPNLAQQPPRLIMVARFNEQKDQATLLKAISQIKSYDFHLDLVGSGLSLESCKTLAASLGILDKVSFLGDRRDVPELLAKSQIFILSTHYEGLPISILEAMRAGLPIVATSVNGIPEEIEDEKTGSLVGHQDVKELTNALSKLIMSTDIRQQMGQKGREKYLQEFTVERMVTEVQAVYEEIFKGRM